MVRVLVPPGTLVIVKSIPASLRQRYGLEAEEGAVFVSWGDDCSGVLQCNNGTQIRVEELRGAPEIEVLSLALVAAHSMSLS